MSRADALLAAVYEEIVRGHLDVALQNIEGLIRVRPNFRLAHLIKGDLLLARARPIDTIGAAPNVPEANLEGLRAEALAVCEPSGSARRRTVYRAICCSGACRRRLRTFDPRAAAAK